VVSPPHDRASVRIDAGVTEIVAERWSRRREHHVWAPDGAGPEDALMTALEMTRFLRPGRFTKLRVILESSTVSYCPSDHVPTLSRSFPDAVATRPARLPAPLLERLASVIAHRRVRGPATLEIGALVRADESLRDAPSRTSVPTQAHAPFELVVDRSNAAVSVLVLGSHGLVWARSVPATDPCAALPILVRRARTDVGHGSRVRSWRLHDVARDPDGIVTARRRSEFEDLATTLLADLCRLGTGPS